MIRLNKQRQSYGIICFYQKPSGLEVLLVKKAVTYNFVQFINGLYKRHTDDVLIKLFSGMTFSEKLDILSCNFASLWRRIYPRDSTDSFKYKKAMDIFEKEMAYHGLNRIKKLMSKNTAIDTLWEIPKGRAYDNEKPIETALREFHEETQNQIHNIEILWHQPPYVESYRDYGVTYINKYYFAIYKDTNTENKTPEKLNIDFYKANIGEVVASRWFPVEQLLRSESIIFINDYLKTLLRNAKKIIKHHIRPRLN